MLEEMSVQAQEAEREYKREYRSRNRKKINRQQREWRANNPEKIKEYKKRYWEKVAKNKKNIRASWQDYNIDRQRYKELQETIRSGKYNAVVHSAAYAANKDIAEYILLSVEKNLSYEGLQTLWELREIERMPCCRTDFYGYRRYFFSILDKELGRVQNRMMEQKKMVRGESCGRNNTGNII